MILEYPVYRVGAWLATNLAILGVVLLVLAGLGILTGYIVAVQRAGPAMAISLVAQSIMNAFRDLFALSLRRLVAMAQLAFKESLRSYVLVVLAVFVVILLFAGWFLDERAENPARLYISFVLKVAGFLSLLMAIFLSAFSIPNDLKNKTIFTVVTKPVRGWEIILGRIIGFGLVGTLILAAMGLMSYVWVVRAVSHTHAVESVEVERDPATGSVRLIRGRTTFDHGHRHEFLTDPAGVGQTMSVKGHYHTVAVDGTGDDLDVSIGPPEEALEARVPIYGLLRFLDRDGNLAAKGINVGKEWAYRGYIEGATHSAGIFYFRDLRSKDFPEGLPLEMTIRVFRTHKGEIERGIRGTMILRNPAWSNPELWPEATRNPDVAKESEPIPFFASDMTREAMMIDRRIEARMPDDSVREVDIFESLVHNGALEIVIQCDERGQYYGMAGTDLYLRASDRWFTVNFIKTYFTIWLRMLIVIALGVMFSTVLSGPVAMLATASTIVLGFFARFITDLAHGTAPGGGPIESLIRNVRQDNLVTELDINEAAGSAIKTIDSIALLFLQGVSSLMPNFGEFSERGGIETSRFVAYGFDIPWQLSVQHLLVALAYIGFCTCIGYFLLESREVAA